MDHSKIIPFSTTQVEGSFASSSPSSGIELSTFAAIAAEAKKITLSPSQSAQNEVSSTELKDALIAMMLCLMKVQSNNAQMQSFLANAANEEASTNLQQTIAAGKSGLEQLQASIEKAQQAQQASFWAKVFGWVVTIVATIALAVTGQVALAAMLLTVQLLSSIPINSSGDTCMSAVVGKLTDALSKLMPPEAAKLVSELVVTIAIVGAMAGVGAISSSAWLLGTFTAAMSTGLLTDSVGDLIDAIIPNSDNNPKLETLKTVLKAMILVIISIIAILKGNTSVGSSSSTLMDGIASFCGKSTSEMAMIVERSATTIQTFGGIGQASSQISQGVLTIEQAGFLKNQAGFKALQAFLEGMLQTIHATQTTTSDFFSDQMKKYNGLLSSLQKDFQIFTAQAHMVAG